ncbi:rhomboid family intramembrane serine protease [Nocardia concava]|uniref:rhomboid family intramembrane serine protease n=1 Tax=Nocardia concava TaxID=257281 RepID=UPI0002FC07BD|nr:rhomboid family intramembrane serine protease [Nocardia concava]
MGKRDYWGPNSFRVRRSRWKAAALRPFGIHTAVYQEIRNIPLEIDDDGEIVAPPGGLFGPLSPEDQVRIEERDTHWSRFREAFVETLFTMPVGSRLIIGNLYNEYARDAGSLDRFVSCTVLDEYILVETASTYDLDYLPPSKRRGLIDLSYGGWAPPSPEEGMECWFRFTDMPAPDAERGRLAKTVERLFTLYSQASLPDDLVVEALMVETGGPVAHPLLDQLDMKSADLHNNIPPRRPARDPEPDDDWDDEDDWDQDDALPLHFAFEPHPLVRAVFQDNTEPVRTRMGASVDSFWRPTPYLTFALIGILTILYTIGATQAHDIRSPRHSWLNVHSSLWLPRIAHGQWHRVFTSPFVQPNLLYLLAAIVCLFLVGREVEVLLGRPRYFAVLLTSILGSAAADVWLVDFPTVGAFTAAAGLLGALLVVLALAPLLRLPLLIGTAIVAGSLVVKSLNHGDLENEWPLIGGFLTGAMTTTCLVHLPHWLRARTPSATRMIGLLGMTAVALAALATIAAAVAWHHP